MEKFFGQADRYEEAAGSFLNLPKVNSMSNAILDWLEKRKVHRELLARWDVLEKQAHAGMVFYQLSEGHREVVTEKLKSDIEQLRDDFSAANLKPPDDLVEFFELLRGAE